MASARGDSGEPAYPPPGAVEYTSIRAGRSLSRLIGLCELLVHYDGGAGLYRVTSMFGVVDDRRGAFTYIELQRLEPWSANAPTNPIVRVVGGPSGGWDIDLRQGEDVGVLLHGPTRENLGFYGLYDLAVFHDREGKGFTNGQLFAREPVTAATLGAYVRAAAEKAGSADCPDRLPDDWVVEDVIEDDEVLPGATPIEALDAGAN